MQERTVIHSGRTRTPRAEAPESARSPGTSDGAGGGGDGDLLRLITCGSVDDGKSTLIGRLLCDTESIHLDQWEAVQRTSVRRGDDRLDLALITDGLRAEREQGITIDVAYRHFTTPTRACLLADTPGHVQYTRNMVTGASTAEVALILIDARHGVVEQTRRHAYLAALLGVHRLVICVNKMDLVGWSADVHDRIVEEMREFALRPDGCDAPADDLEWPFGAVQIDAVPVSALAGDNVVERSPHMPWYAGPTLLELLESVPVRPRPESAPARFPVQWVIRPQSELHPDYRGYAGRMASGKFEVGQPVLALPSGRRSRISGIALGEDLTSIAAPLSATIELQDDLDLSRGDILVPDPDATAASTTATDVPRVTRELRAIVVWMDDRPLDPSRRYLIKHGTRWVRATVGPITQRLDMSSLRLEPGPDGAAWPNLKLNEIGAVNVRLAAPLVCDPYVHCRETGSFIIVDEASNATAGAGLIRGGATDKATRP